MPIPPTTIRSLGAAVVSFPNADAVILLSQKKITLRTDASVETVIHQVVKIESDAGVRQFGDLKFDYNQETEHIDIITARTIKTDSTIVPVEKKAINNLTLHLASQAPEYLNHKQLVISFPALEAGSVIDIKLKKTSRTEKNNKNLLLSGSEVFQSTIPIIYKEIVVKIPKNTPLYYNNFFGLSNPSKSADKNYHTYIWYFRHAPPIHLEPHMPPFADFAPVLYFTTRSSWQENGQWLGDRFFPKIDTSEKIINQVRRLTQGLTEETERIKALHNHVMEGIKDIQVPLALTEYRPKSAQRTLSNHYGNSLDKSLLLISMLQSAKINA